MATTISAYDRHVEQLSDVIARLAGALSRAGIEYRVIGGVAVFLHVHERDPLAARSTRDVDIAVGRGDLPRIVEAVRGSGFEHRHAAGVDMLVDTNAPRARNAVHLILIRTHFFTDEDRRLARAARPRSSGRAGRRLEPARDIAPTFLRPTVLSPCLRSVQ